MLNFINSYLSFNKMMGESLVRKWFYLAVGVSVLAYIYAIIVGLKMIGRAPLETLKGFALLTILLIIYLILFRVLAEFFIATFRTRDRMTELRNHALGDVWVAEKSKQTPVEAMREAAEKAKEKASSTAKAAKAKLDKDGD